MTKGRYIILTLSQEDTVIRHSTYLNHAIDEVLDPVPYLVPCLYIFIVRTWICDWPVLSYALLRPIHRNTDFICWTAKCDCKVYFLPRHVIQVFGGLIRYIQANFQHSFDSPGTKPLGISTGTLNRKPRFHAFEPSFGHLGTGRITSADKQYWYHVIRTASSIKYWNWYVHCTLFHLTFFVGNGGPERDFSLGTSMQKL